MGKNTISANIKIHINKVLSATRPFLQNRSFFIIEDEIKKELACLFQVSNFAINICSSYPNILANFLCNICYEKPLNLDNLKFFLDEKLMNIQEEKDFMKKIRILHHEQMLRILWRDANDYVAIENTMEELSIVADSFLDIALNWLYQKLVKKLGSPEINGIKQQMVIFGMGKLGGSELNFSSDVDLIFCYPKVAITKHEERTTDHHVFFNKLSRSLIKVIETITSDGFVYRVDMRLRPYGTQGHLAISFNSMEQYYQNQGRDWERYALVKARPVAGDIKAGYKLLQALEPFIYRRYLDFSAIDSLRYIKSLILKDIKKRKIKDDIKHGAGGIREIEFVVQFFQLVYGGKKKQLQQQNLMLALEQIEHLNLLKNDETKILGESYIFLRNVEHLLQIYEKRQTHMLPLGPSRVQLIAESMNFINSEKFENALKLYRASVNKIFNELLKLKNSESKSTVIWQQLWEMKHPPKKDIQLLKSKNFQNAENVYERLLLIKKSQLLDISNTSSKRIIDKFFPVFLQKCATENDPFQAYSRTLFVVQNVLKRTVYLKLLMEKPEVLDKLIKLCQKSEWMSQEIAKFPALLDELLININISKPPDKDTLKYELKNQIKFIEEDDVDLRLEALCYFKISNILKAVVSVMFKHMVLIDKSNYLTWVAEVILDEIVEMSWNIMVKKYGLPHGVKKNEKPFIVLGYGKFGGLEMGLDSDLDLVFIHNTDPHALTSSNACIDNQIFFSRFAQKIIRFCSLETHSGKLYETDIRLRPSGNSGLLVSTLNGYIKYIEEKAWVWEIQALVRARVICGNLALIKDEFENARKLVIQKKRDIVLLREEVKKMRIKMNSLDTSNIYIFNMKYGRGGIVDIEFLVQYTVLLHANICPSLVTWTDNIRILEIIKKQKLIAVCDSDEITRIYILLRSKIFKKSLNYETACIESSEFILERNHIIKLWNKYLDDHIKLIH